jgi:hypothetical protein
MGESDVLDKMILKPIVTFFRVFRSFCILSIYTVITVLSMSDKRMLKKSGFQYQEDGLKLEMEETKRTLSLVERRVQMAFPPADSAESR